MKNINIRQRGAFLSLQTVELATRLEYIQMRLQLAPVRARLEMELYAQTNIRVRPLRPLVHD